MDDDTRTTYVMHAFIVGWTKGWKQLEEFHSSCAEFDPPCSDIFHRDVMLNVEGRVHEDYNRRLAKLFGEIVTKVKTFPTSDGSWIILDKHTKRLLHKDVKNENEVNTLCKTNGYVR